MIKMKEIKASHMNVGKFIDDQVRKIREAVGDDIATVVALGLEAYAGAN